MRDPTEMHNCDPDSMLVLAAQGGDKEALAVLIDRHRPLLLALCRRTLGDTVAAEDAVHEAVLQAMLSLDRLRRPKPRNSGPDSGIVRPVRRPVNVGGRGGAGYSRKT